MAGETTTMKRATTVMKKIGSKEGEEGGSASQLIEARIKELGDWRGEMLARVRMLIQQADPEVVEEWKWRGFQCGRMPESSAPARRTRMS